MNKDLIETQAVELADHRLMVVQKLRRQLERRLASFEKAVQQMPSDRAFYLAMNHHSPQEWAAMSPAARKRILAIEMGFRPVETVRRRPKSSKRAGVTP